MSTYIVFALRGSNNHISQCLGNGKMRLHCRRQVDSYYQILRKRRSCHVPWSTSRRPMTDTLLLGTVNKTIKTQCRIKPHQHNKNFAHRAGSVKSSSIRNIHISFI